MAVSYYSNWGAGTFEEHGIPEMMSMSTFPQAELFGFDHNNDNLTLCNSIDPLLFINPDIGNINDDYVVDNDFLISHNYFNNTTLQPLIPYTSPPLTHDHLFDYSQEFESYQHRYPKCQKISYCSDLTTTTAYNNYNYDYNCDYDNGFVPINNMLMPEFQADHHLPWVCNSGMINNDDDGDHEKSGNVVVVVKKPTTNLSAQSIAARQRRRKITDKTQELGKLIPGAHKFNTAEMFQAAFNYIKFLQSQVGILQFVQKNGEEGCHTKELEHLVQSPLIQEKLYSEEKCLLPKQFVETLAKDPQLHSSTPSIIKDINQLIPPPS